MTPSRRIVSLIAAVCIAPTIAPAAFPCFNLDSSPSPCAGCAFAICSCFYAGHECVTAQISCYWRFEPIDGANNIRHADTTPCYWTRDCKSLNGGQCHPSLNPCVMTGETTYVGNLMIYELDLPCS